MSMRPGATGRAIVLSWNSRMKDAVDRVGQLLHSGVELVHVRPVEGRPGAHEDESGHPSGVVDRDALGDDRAHRMADDHGAVDV
jgi:hypothetical protein